MNTIKMKVAVKNSTDSILAALIVSIKTEMMAAYDEQLSALSSLKATAGDISNTKAVSEAISDLKELENAIHMISDALDKEFKPKHVIRTNKTALCPNCHHRVPNPNHSYCHRCGQKLIHRGNSDE